MLRPFSVVWIVSCLVLSLSAQVQAQTDFLILPTFLASAQAEMVLHDVNGDGEVDMITADGILNLVSIHLSNGDGTFGAPSTVTISAGVRALAVGDVNGDGLSDIVLAYPGELSGTNGIVSVSLNQGGGVFFATCRSSPYRVSHYGRTSDASFIDYR